MRHAKDLSTLSRRRLVGKISVLGPELSDEVKTLKGQTVEMSGFMAPPLKDVAENSVVAAPAGFTKEDFTFLVILLGAVASIATIPALLAYRLSPAAALRA